MSKRQGDYDNDGKEWYTRRSKVPQGATWIKVASYVYEDLLGRPYMRVERHEAWLKSKTAASVPVKDLLTGKVIKKYPQWWVGGENGGWKKPLGAPNLPFRLPQLLEAIRDKQTIYICEGEHKAEALREWGLVATCNAGGAGSWTAEHAWHLRGAVDVVIMPDNDVAGEDHADSVGRSLAFVPRRRLLALPGLPNHGDIRDWKESGGTKEQFVELAAAAPEWQPYNDEEDDRAKSALVMVRVSDVAAKNIDWLWKPRIARGKLTMIAGMPDVNKSTLLLYLAAMITIAGPLPGGEGNAPLGSVIILTAEDDVADTVRPRLEVAGANVDRVHVITATKDNNKERGFDLTVDIDRLKKAVVEIGDVVMIVIDPVSAYMGKPGKLNSYRITDVRGTLAPLGKMAEETGVAVVGIDHLNKSSGAQALLRIIGSIAFSAAPRSIYLIVRDEEDEDKRLFLPAKNNIAKIRTGLAFRVIEKFAPPLNDGYPAIKWEDGIVTMTADEALALKPDGRKSEPAELAKKLLEEILAKGPVPATAIKARAKLMGISERSLETARKALDVQAKREGGRVGGRWIWSLEIHF